MLIGQAAARRLPLQRSAYVLRRPWRLLSTVTHYSASKDALREVPTRLVLLSASSWSKEPAAQVGLSPFIEKFSKEGWNVTCLDLDPEGEDGIHGLADSNQILAKLESELKRTLRSDGSPFPPLMVAQGLSTLIAETYVSSNSLSGLALLDPPLTPVTAHERHPDILPTPLSAFTYEPRFPCLVAWSPHAVKQLAFWDIHRIEEVREEEADEAVDRYVWHFDSAEDKEKAGAFELHNWAEEQGIADDDTQTDELDVDIGDHAALDKGGSSGRKIPDWFKQGAYKRNPSRSKKEPLLLDDRDLEESFIRGSGPGGQAINKLATCVQLKHKPTGRVIRCQETRSRQENRMHARRRMSKELERLVFGESGSTLGQNALRERRKKLAKSRKRRRRAEGQGE